MAALVPGTPAGAAPTLSRSPASGPAPSTISVSGTECPAGKTIAGAALLDSNQDVVSATDDLPVQAGGSWSGTLDVPAGTPVGAYEVDAVCGSSADDPDPFFYDPLPFAVTASSGSTSTTVPGTGGLLDGIAGLLGGLLGGSQNPLAPLPSPTTPTTTPAPATPPPATAPPAATAPAATPVEGQLSFTG
jgi:hypothetical protein